jgi:hypothetical protein
MAGQAGLTKANLMATVDTFLGEGKQLMDFNIICLKVSEGDLIYDNKCCYVLHIT